MGGRIVASMRSDLAVIYVRVQIRARRRIRIALSNPCQAYFQTIKRQADAYRIISRDDFTCQKLSESRDVESSSRVGRDC